MTKFFLVKGLSARFQLTRSVGSVTTDIQNAYQGFAISTHTLRGERDSLFSGDVPPLPISTHTLRGERDIFITPNKITHRLISTHTLRGERDVKSIRGGKDKDDFNSHAPWGA